MRKGKERETKRLSIAAIALVTGALILAGCGGSSGGSSSGTTTTTSAGGSESSGSEGTATEGGPPIGENGEPPEGFEPPEGGELPEGGEIPEGGPTAADGPMGEEISKAFEECGVEMPEFKVGPGGEGRPNVNSAEFKKQVKEYVACVRETVTNSPNRTSPAKARSSKNRNRKAPPSRRRANSARVCSAGQGARNPA